MYHKNLTPRNPHSVICTFIESRTYEEEWADWIGLSPIPFELYIPRWYPAENQLESRTFRASVSIEEKSYVLLQASSKR